MNRNALVCLGALALACGSPADQSDAGNDDDASSSPDSSMPTNDAGSKPDAVNDAPSTNDATTPTTKVIFVIPMENKAQTQIYGNMTDAPYINGTLLTAYAHTTNFNDELPALASEPHYVWMESGTNVFSDHTFSTDGDSTPTNSTSHTEHLVAQLDAASIGWTSYQEGITEGTCPISSISKTFYAAKHNPFVFFQDVVGSPPSASNAKCASHHKAITSLAADLKNGTVSSYNFITPDLCHEMHGDSACSQGTADSPNIQAGDTWLKDNLQPMIDYANAHDGYVFITWDEGDSTNLIPFIAIGKNAIAGHAGSVKYTHTSLLKSEEEILGVPVLPSAMTANDFGDLFSAFP